MPAVRCATFRIVNLARIAFGMSTIEKMRRFYYVDLYQQLRQDFKEENSAYPHTKQRPPNCRFMENVCLLVLLITVV